MKMPLIFQGCDLFFKTALAIGKKTFAFENGSLIHNKGPQKMHVGLENRYQKQKVYKYLHSGAISYEAGSSKSICIYREE